MHETCANLLIFWNSTPKNTVHLIDSNVSILKITKSAKSLHPTGHLYSLSTHCALKSSEIWHWVCVTKH